MVKTIHTIISGSGNGSISQQLLKGARQWKVPLMQNETTDMVKVKAYMPG